MKTMQKVPYQMPTGCQDPNLSVHLLLHPTITHEQDTKIIILELTPDQEETVYLFQFEDLGLRIRKACFHPGSFTLGSKTLQIRLKVGKPNICSEKTRSGAIETGDS
ncbi:hypothetical protein ILYODFUR_008053 [Ilyodon furcidens]|uniref:Uncharacterized protein n=1 Tax=Ilyodon furcidens TaxID=33524 RepID=A0ABV0TGV9_9TELE